MARMVGRDHALAEVLACVADPGVAMTLVVGDAGIGKSRLVAEAVAAGPERLTLFGRCLPMQHVLPLGAVVDALDTRDPVTRRTLTRAVHALPRTLRPALVGVMPRTLPSEIVPASEVRREQLFVACEALLSEVAQTRPLTLVIEDVHWADSDTLDLLTYLAGARHSPGLHLLATCRLDEAQPTGPLATWVDAQHHVETVHELRLRPLEPQDVGDLVADLAGAKDVDPDALMELVLARGQGNPFFTEQLVAAAAEGERLPRGLARFLSGRVRATSVAAQQVITALAVLGRPVPVSAVRGVTLQTEDVCLAAVRELESASLVLRSDGTLEPKHALLREVLLDELPGLSSAYHLRVATALESLDDPSAVAEIVDHLGQGGDSRRELRVAQMAAQRAWELTAFIDAARWYRRVSELHARLPDAELTLTEAELTRRRIRALDLGGARLEATAVAEQAIQDFAEWPDVRERLRLLTLAAHLVTVEDRDRGRRLMEELLLQFGVLPPSQDHVQALAWISVPYVVRGDYGTALSYLERALSLSRALSAVREEAHVLSRISIVLRHSGDRAAADVHAAEALHIGERAGDVDALLDALVAESDNRLKYAEFRAAVAAAERGLRVTEQTGRQGSFTALLLLNNAAEAHLALGEVAEVGRLVDTVTDRPLRPDDDMLSWLRAHADLRRGDPHGALSWLRGRSGLRPKDTASYRAHGAALAEVLLWNGRPAETLDVVEDALAAVTARRDVEYAGQLLALAARAVAQLVEDARVHDGTPGREADDLLTRLDALVSSIAGDPFAARETLVRATADGHQWEAERRRIEKQSDPDAWYAAAHRWETLAMPHEAAYCWWRAAQALRTSDAGQAALRDALHAAHRLCEEHVPLRSEIGRLATQARIPILSASPVTAREPVAGKGLTAQESKVLRLVAGGLTNAEIGAALFISPKTASVHVSNVLRKLQVANRAEAAAWATRHGVTAD